MRPLKKRADVYGSNNNSSNSKTSGARTAPSIVLKVIPQEKAIEYIKGGNSDGLQELISQAGEDLAFLNLMHTKTGRHPLAVAAEEGRQLETQILIAAKVEIDKRDNDGMTALLHAAKNGEPDILKMLLEAGADIFVRHEETREDLLFLAVKHRRLNVTRQLIELGREVETVNIRHETPLWNAIKLEQYEIAELLLQQGANINVTRPGGDSLLLAAAFTGTNFTQIDFLLDHGADITWHNESGINVFMLCARHGHDELLRKLLTFCLDRDRDLEQARKLASEYGGKAMEYVKLPNVRDIDYRSLVDAQDAGKKTALMYAALHSKLTCVEILLNEGHANPLLQDLWGYTALFFAVRAPYRSERTSAGTKNKMAGIVDVLIAAQNPEQLEQFNILDKCYNNALSHACMTQNIQFAERLIDAGCDYLVRNIDEKLPVDLITAEENRNAFQDMIATFAAHLKRFGEERERPVQNVEVKPKWLRTLNRELYSKK